MYVIVGTAPDQDNSVTVGPFRTYDRAIAAGRDVEAYGYVTEVCELLKVTDLDPRDWSDSE